MHGAISQAPEAFTPWKLKTLYLSRVLHVSDAKRHSAARAPAQGAGDCSQEGARSCWIIHPLSASSIRSLYPRRRFAPFIRVRASPLLLGFFFKNQVNRSKAQMFCFFFERNRFNFFLAVFHFLRGSLYVCKNNNNKKNVLKFSNNLRLSSSEMF